MKIKIPGRENRQLSEVFSAALQKDIVNPHDEMLDRMVGKLLGQIQNMIVLNPDRTKRFSMEDPFVKVEEEVEEKSEKETA